MVRTDLPANPEFKFDIVEIKPVSPYKTVSIINCDLNLDFEAPLDYVEPEQPSLQKRSSSVLMGEGRSFLMQKITRKRYSQSSLESTPGLTISL
jgi:hypothetical protein